MAKQYQIKSLEDAEGNFKTGLGILAALNLCVDSDTYERISKHVDEILIEIHNVKNS